MEREDLEDAKFVKVWETAQDFDWRELVYLTDEFVLVASQANDREGTISLEEVPLDFIVNSV